MRSFSSLSTGAEHGKKRGGIGRWEWSAPPLLLRHLPVRVLWCQWTTPKRRKHSSALIICSFTHSLSGWSRCASHPKHTHACLFSRQFWLAGQTLCLFWNKDRNLRENKGLNLRLHSYVRDRTKTGPNLPPCRIPLVFHSASLPPGAITSDPAKAPAFGVFLPWASNY